MVYKMNIFTVDIRQFDVPQRIGIIIIPIGRFFTQISDFNNTKKVARTVT